MKKRITEEEKKFEALIKQMRKKGNWAMLQKEEAKGELTPKGKALMKEVRLRQVKEQILSLGRESADLLKENLQLKEDLLWEQNNNSRLSEESNARERNEPCDDLPSGDFYAEDSNEQ